MEFHKAQIGQLMHAQDLRHIPAAPGIYLVGVPFDGFEPNISDATTGPRFVKGRSMLYPASKLKEKFNLSDKRCLYIGESDNLQHRITLFLQYGRGEDVPHRGGRAIWQIANSDELILAWCPCPNHENVKSALLASYRQSFGVLPMANQKSGKFIAYNGAPQYERNILQEPNNNDTQTTTHRRWRW